MLQWAVCLQKVVIFSMLKVATQWVSYHSLGLGKNTYTEQPHAMVVTVTWWMTPWLHHPMITQSLGHWSGVGEGDLSINVSNETHHKGGRDGGRKGRSHPPSYWTSSCLLQLHSLPSVPSPPLPGHAPPNFPEPHLLLLPKLHRSQSHTSLSLTFKIISKILPVL